jgi:hypothetical protein
MSDERGADRIDPSELEERVRELRRRFDEFRGRL